MTRFAIASEFDDGRRYWTGGFKGYSVVTDGFVPATTADAGAAMVLTERAQADLAAQVLTDMCRMFPPHDSRTWYVAEISAPIRVIPKPERRA